MILITESLLDGDECVKRLKKKVKALDKAHAKQSKADKAEEDE